MPSDTQTIQQQRRESKDTKEVGSSPHLLARSSASISAKKKKKFWEKVDIKGSDDCWMWKACKLNGYGSFGVGGNTKWIAHRVSWLLAYGPIPDNLCVLHRCDTPACVNPAHLFLGTRKDNNSDKAAKGRTVNGWMTGAARRRSLKHKQNQNIKHENI